MAPAVEIDEETLRSLEFAARIAGTTPGVIVARLVAEASTRADASDQSEVAVAVFADYEGHRTHGKYDQTTRRIDITSGPLAGQSYKTPTGAARAVVAHYKPNVNPSRNGWGFWVLDDGSGNQLWTIKESA